MSSSILLISLAIVQFFGSTVPKTPPEIYVDNTAKYSDGYYYWTIFIKANPDVLSNVDRVEYRLHPSYPNNVQIIHDRGGACAFPLSSSSWSEFSVKVRVFFKDGSEQQLDHWLNLVKNKNDSGCDVRSPSPTNRKPPRRRP